MKKEEAMKKGRMVIVDYVKVSSYEKAMVDVAIGIVYDTVMKEAEEEMELLVDLLLKKNNEDEIHDIPEAVVWLSQEIRKRLGGDKK